MEDFDDFIDEEQDTWEDLEPVEGNNIFENPNDDEYSFEGDEEFDKAVLDMDFSEFKGDARSSFTKIKHTIKKKRQIKPLTKRVEVDRRANIGGGRKQIKKVIIPNDRHVTVQGVSEFILSDAPEKKIGYYLGKKLKELIIRINNTSNVDFDLELFNPSMPVDFLQSTSGNLNDRIVLSGTDVTYSDMLHNLLANPTLIANARFNCTGSNVKGQKEEKLTFLNKAIDGESVVKPMQLNLHHDLYQVQGDVILFDIIGQLNRVFIPDGMDIIKYNVLAGNDVTFCFYYKQKSLKKFFFKEAREKHLVLDEFRQIL